jgi:FkbM family methyltransferase
MFSLPWGCEIKVDPRKAIGRSIAQTGIYELATSELLWRLLQPGDQALDIGANIGYMTGLMGMRVGRAGKVYAFEPHPQLFRQLAENVDRLRATNNFGQVELYERAVSDCSTRVNLLAPNEFNKNDGLARVVATDCAGGDLIPVQAVTLDALLADRGVFAVAKIDVEGHELKVIQGGAQLFADKVMHVVFEDHAGPSSPVCQLLQKMGFSILQFGWSLRRLIFASLGNGSLSRRYDAPNFIATKHPNDVLELCRVGGWQVLRRR